MPDVVANGRYRITGRVDQFDSSVPSEPGDTAVFLAYDLLLQRQVVLKAFHGGDASSYDRLLREGANQARINSKYVLSVYDIGVLADGDSLNLPQNSYFLVLEYVAPAQLGGLNNDSSILPWLASKPAPSLSDRYHVMLCVAKAVCAAHDVGVTHQDIKADNILLDYATTPPSPKLCDFGISEVIGGLKGLRGGHPRITVEYAPPEQFRGVRTAHGDIYSLGVTFYLVLTSSLPFVADTPQGLSPAEIQQYRAERYRCLHNEVDPVPPIVAVPAIDKEISDLVVSMLRKAALDRPSADRVSAILQKYVDPRAFIETVYGEKQHLPVYVLDAALQNGPITDNPRATLYEQCVEAATEILDNRPQLRADIDAIYLGTMGVFKASLTPSHIPTVLRDGLRLKRLPGGLNTCVATSEAGAVALLKAYEDIQMRRVRTALVVAGESMLSPTIIGADAKEREKKEIQTWLLSALDPREAAQGLTMLGVGDMLMDHFQWRSGLDDDLWREILETATLNKYEFARMYPRGLQPSKELSDPSKYCDVDAYRSAANPEICLRYRKHDVCPNANGATALVLTSSPPEGIAHRIRLLGMGEGMSKVAVGDRSGPMFWSGAIRRALRALCYNACVTPSLLWDQVHTSGILHDAFPSIELSFLRALSPNAQSFDEDEDWPELVRRFYRGWSNPFGGLSASGHALGNSGLLQVVKAFHILTRDRRYIEPKNRPPEATAYDEMLRAPFFLTTSVGSALTHVVTALLMNECDSDAFDTLRRVQANFKRSKFFPRPTQDFLLRDIMNQIDDDECVVIGRTRRGRVYLYLVRGRTGFALRSTPANVEPLPVGQCCKVENGQLTRTQRAAKRPAAARNRATKIRADLNAWQQLVLPERYNLKPR